MVRTNPEMIDDKKSWMKWFKKVSFQFWNEIRIIYSVVATLVISIHKINRWTLIKFCNNVIDQLQRNVVKQHWTSKNINEGCITFDKVASVSPQARQLRAVETPALHCLGERYVAKIKKFSAIGIDNLLWHSLVKL